MKTQHASLLFVLHAHQSFVREPHQDDCPEERALYKALTESYLPLLAMLLRLERDGIPYALTLSLSPTLLSMLDDRLRQGRYLQYLSQEQQRCTEQQGMVPNQILEARQEKLAALLSLYLSIGCDLAQAFAERPGLELITSPLSQPILPLLDRETARLQIQLAEEQHLARFGQRAAGIWLPACAYTPGLEELFLHASYTFLEPQGLLQAAPRAVFGPFAPTLSPHKVAFFAKDQASIDLLLGESGYIFDTKNLDTAAIANAQQHSTSFLVQDTAACLPSYCRAPIDQPEQLLYDAELAKRGVWQQAKHFVESRAAVAQELRSRLRREPLFVIALPAELLGQDWFEGTHFLEAVFRQIANNATLDVTTPKTYLSQHRSLQQLRPNASSSEDEGLFSIWTRHENLSFLAHCQRQARSILQQAPDVYAQAALRELLLAQAREHLETPHNKARERQHALTISKTLLSMSQGKSLRDPSLVSARQAQTPPWNLIWTKLSSMGKITRQ